MVNFVLFLQLLFLLRQRHEYFSQVELKLLHDIFDHIDDDKSGEFDHFELEVFVEVRKFFIATISQMNIYWIFCFTLPQQKCYLIT